MDRDQLQEALGTARQMRNALKAFEHVEGLIAFLAQMEAATVDTQARLDALAVQEKSLSDKRDQAQAELASAKEALLDLSKTERAKIRKEIDAERELANRKIDAFKKNVAAAEQLSEDARSAHEALLADLHNEIAVKTGIRDSLQAEIDALKKKFD